MSEKTNKLLESIPASPMKILDLYNKIDNELLNTGPDYQRKLVWKKQHKYAFIDTILMNYPFPEIYIASTDINVDKMEASEVVVDGQQRLTTIVDYIKGEGDFLKQNKVTAFKDLSAGQKKEFLNYKVSVRDLKEISETLIKEIFLRINSTEYSLNSVEKNNALYGDGEIAIFCKQLIDKNYVVTIDDTDIIVDIEKRKVINDFFESNEIFNENDKKRMYDFQYFMLLTATILEGNYFGRSVKVDEYLEKHNSEFKQYEIVLDAIYKSINVINALGFSKNSYWFNKANIFTLIIQLCKIQNKEEIDLAKLEFELLKLEDKTDIYFTAEQEEEIKEISEDERKYFEVARHGSHEKSAREIRGKVIGNLLEISLIKNQTPLDDKILRNLEKLNHDKISFAILIPTETGLTKSILDAVTSVRELLKTQNVHNYENQQNGPDNKVKLTCYFVGEKEMETEVSLYRSNGRGDYRIWFKNLSDFAEANDNLALTIDKGVIKLLNLSRIEYTNII